MRRRYIQMDEEGEWFRLMKWLREQRDAATQQVLSGACTPEDYRSFCARHAAFDETLNQARIIRRGEDVRPPPPPSLLRSVEE